MRIASLYKSIIALWLATQSCLVAEAGIRKDEKWQHVSRRLSIDTQDVEIKGYDMRFYVKTELGARKLRIRCNKTDFRTERFMGWDYGWVGSSWESLTEGSVYFEIANQLCFLTRSPNATPEKDQPQWALQIIHNIDNKRP